MTSKISYIKLIRADLRHRGWLAALVSIGLFLEMPVFTMLYIDSLQMQNREYIVIEELRAAFPGLLNGQSVNHLAAVIAVIAVLCALTGFGYIHSKDKTDFFHSLPVKRGQWFVVNYLSGLIIFLLPYVICSALTIAVGGAFRCYYLNDHIFHTTD